MPDTTGDRLVPVVAASLRCARCGRVGPPGLAGLEPEVAVHFVRPHLVWPLHVRGVRAGWAVWPGEGGPCTVRYGPGPIGDAPAEGPDLRTGLEEAVLCAVAAPRQVGDPRELAGHAGRAERIAAVWHGAPGSVAVAAYRDWNGCGTVVVAPTEELLRTAAGVALLSFVVEALAPQARRVLVTVPGGAEDAVRAAHPRADPVAVDPDDPATCADAADVVCSVWRHGLPLPIPVSMLRRIRPGSGWCGT